MANDNAWLTVSSGALTAQINPLGAQLSTLRDPSGRELLWDGNPAFWNGRAPLLFPIVGTLSGGVYRVAGKTYALSRHGFARGKLFEVLSASSVEAVLRLKADDETFAVYPFYFQLQVRFEIRDSMLMVKTLVRNDGDAPMPASFGYHPAFRWPLPFGAARALHAIEFDLEEPDAIRRLDTAGLVTPIQYPTPIRARRLLLDDELFRADVVIFAAIRSQRLRSRSRHGSWARAAVSGYAVSAALEQTRRALHLYRALAWNGRPGGLYWGLHRKARCIHRIAGRTPRTHDAGDTDQRLTGSTEG